MTFSQSSAETVALQALAWLAANDELMPIFLSSTGASEADMRQGVSDPVFLGSVLDFLMMDDAWIMQFADQAGLGYEAIAQVRMALPGGEQVNWT